MLETLHSFGEWDVVLPLHAVTPAHLAIVRGVEDGSHSAGDHWADLLTAYRATRSALNAAYGCDGFAVSFTLNWTPDDDAVGEPHPLPAASAIHVFGRHVDESHRPAQQMSVPAGLRQRVGWDPATVDQMRAALRHPTPELIVPRLDDADCDGCADTVVRDQERWRHDGVRVIRPRYCIIDAQVMLLPLRHVVSLSDLTGHEAESMARRLEETRDQFRQSAGSSGLSCFANDGARAGQHTPHVHLHVFGRSRSELTNPFALLAARTQR